MRPSSRFLRFSIDLTLYRGLPRSYSCCQIFPCRSTVPGLRPTRHSRLKHRLHGDHRKSYTRHHRISLPHEARSAPFPGPTFGLLMHIHRIPTVIESPPNDPAANAHRFPYNIHSLIDRCSTSPNEMMQSFGRGTPIYMPGRFRNRIKPFENLNRFRAMAGTGILVCHENH